MPTLPRSAAAVLLSITLGHAIALAQAPRFYPDDPVTAEPAPIPIASAEPRALSSVLELFDNAFSPAGQRQPAEGVIPAAGVNTLGEVMDGEWYVNRHARRRMTLDELQRGPGTDRPPSTTAPWRVLVVKRYGVNPGLIVSDAKNDLYVLRFDPYGYEGLATGAQMVASRLLYAAGYHVTEDYLVRFSRAQLEVHESGQTVASSGRNRKLEPNDIAAFLKDVTLGAGDTYRAVATRLPGPRQTLLGPFQMWGTRSDDPNDTVPHEHHRELRGLFVFSAWLNNANARAVTTQDVLTTTNGPSRIRHLLVGLTGALGSGADGPKTGWAGNEAFIPDFGTIGRNILGLGIYTPAWMRAKPPGLREVGTFTSDTFEPERWAAVHAVPPFANRLPDDTFWAARQVMAFTDQDIRAIVQTGQYTKAAEDWITATLIERRNRIGRTYFSRVLPLDRIHVESGALAFDDLGVTHGFSGPRTYTVEWFGFDNAKGTVLANIGSGVQVPPAAQALAAGEYVAARIHGGDPAMHVTAYLRKRADGLDLVGLDRAWPGKVIAPPVAPVRADRRVYADLAPQQRALFETYVPSYNTPRGTQYTAEEVFGRLTISEETTFYGVTHALLHTDLRDKGGGPLGPALDLVASVDRIAGQYAGRSGDGQFRIFVTLKPDAQAVLERSSDFFLDSENTVYHAGYPRSYRQAGKPPNLQFSLAEDAVHADIDVDYRSSRSPQALFNGHLTAANSDIRAGENPKVHSGRWQGLVAWWQGAFGRLAESAPKSTELLNMERPDVPSAPLPPARPSGAEPDRIEDAAQEFLTDWLVRRQYDQALEFLSPQAYACVNRSDEARQETLDVTGARRELRRLMEYSITRLGIRGDLANTIESVPAPKPDRVVDHPFRNQFLMVRLPEADAQKYLCSGFASPPSGSEYVGVVFTFRIEGGGTLGLLWSRVNGAWKIIAYQPIRP